VMPTIVNGDRHPRGDQGFRLPTRAVEMLEVRPRIARWAVDAEELLALPGLGPQGGVAPQEQLDALEKFPFDELFSELDESTDCFWVTAAMMDLLDAARLTFPTSVDVEMPSHRGFVVFESPIRPWLPTSQLVRGFVWVDGVVSLLVSFERPSDPIGLWVECLSSPLPMTSIPTSAHPTVIDLWKIAAACVTLMGQRLAGVSSVHPDRASRRRLDRLGVKAIAGVQVVDLRRPPTGGARHGDGSAVNWSRRWIVGGHWRNQWVPSTGGHRPTWIAPYVKGPEDKPIVARGRVYRWSR